MCMFVDVTSQIRIVIPVRMCVCAVCGYMCIYLYDYTYVNMYIVGTQVCAYTQMRRYMDVFKVVLACPIEI